LFAGAANAQNDWPLLSPQTLIGNAGEASMQIAFSSLIALRNLLLREEGQDLVEYALVVALISLAATAGMNTVASDISNAFSSLGGTLSGDI
jgi:pilus assembly protein Flp/PilA